MMAKRFLCKIIICMLLASLPVSAADFVLEIYGNANMDDRLNSDDLQYLESILAGKDQATKLADANFDGKIDKADLEQVQAILDGKDKKLTFVDLLGENVTVNKPIKRLVNLGYNGVEMTRILGAEDILVAYGENRTTHKKFFPKLAQLPFVGADPKNCDYEKIISLNPDAVQTNLERPSSLVGGLDQKHTFEKNLKNIPLICLDMRGQDNLVKNVRTYGYILDRESEAEKFIDWYSKYYNLFNNRTASIPDNKKPTAVVEYTPYYCYASGSNLGQVLTLAGGKNILDTKIGPKDPKYGSMLDIEPEFVIQEDPKYIIKAVGSWDSGYDIDNSSKMAAFHEQVINRTELANVDAVKDDHVYCMSFWILSGAGNNIIGTAYMAKLLYPDLFKDIDPEAIHQEYVDKFCHIDFDVKKNGTFVYPNYDQWLVKN
jgi:iron complex transport system substrate-binding protein